MPPNLPPQKRLPNSLLVESTDEKIGDREKQGLQNERFTVTKRNQENSPLLGLPPELRNMVYKYVLGGNTYLVGLDGSFPAKFELALLVVCRQITAEAHLLPYAYNTFSFIDRLPYLDSYEFPYQRTTAQKLAITSIGFRTKILCTKRITGICQIDTRAQSNILYIFPNISRIYVRIEVHNYRKERNATAVKTLVESVRTIYKRLEEKAEVSYDLVLLERVKQAGCTRL
ncbi:beta transducin [Ascochyta lentis]